MEQTNLEQIESKQEMRVMTDEDLKQLGGKRLVFEEATRAVVEDVIFKEGERKPTEKGDVDIQCLMNIKYKLGTPVDGMEVAYTNYAFHLYEKPDKTRVVYLGANSHISKLRALISSTLGIDAKTIDPAGFKKHLIGRTVFIKSEKFTNPKTNELVSKAMIIQIRLD